MKYRLPIGLAVLAIMAAALAAQKFWLASDDRKTAKIAPPTETIKLEDRAQWQSIPELLASALVLPNPDPSSPALGYTATKDDVVLLAASFTFDGNLDDREPWPAECKTFSQLLEDGWIPIAKLMLADQTPYCVFRRNVHSGDKLSVRTRLKTPGYFLTAPEEDLAKINAAPPLVGKDRKTMIEAYLPELNQAATAHATPGVIGVHSPEPIAFFGDSTGRGLLLREIVRQGVLLAGREELQMPTRDSDLRETIQSANDSDLGPLEVMAGQQPFHEIQLAILRKHKDTWEVLYDDDVRLPPENLYLNLTKAIEARSRNEFVAVLKQAGFESDAHVVSRDQAPVPPEASEFAGDLNIPAQFGAVRLLHAEIRQHGQSPELLSALARSYALLGVLTDHYYSSAAKVFDARAMLYAERAVQRWPDSALALNTRGFVQALVGFHGNALKDFDAAAKLAQKKSNDGPPLWKDAIYAYCRFDDDALHQAGVVASQRSLVRLLEMLAAEHTLATKPMIDASHALYDDVPGCLRAIDGASNVNTLGVYRMSVEVGTEATAQVLLPQVRKTPELPTTAAKLIDEMQTPASGGGVFSRLFGSGNPPDEMSVRLKVISALREAGAAKLDQGEPSWEALGQLMQEVTFLNAWRQIHLAASWWSVPADDFIDSALTQVPDHPYVKFLESFRTDRDRSQAALTEFCQTFELSRVCQWELPMIKRISESNPDWTNQHLPGGMYWHDAVAFEMMSVVNNSKIPKTAAKRLREISPNLPYGIVMGLSYDIDDLRKRKPELEKQYRGEFSVQTMLGQSYLHDGQLDDAIRCFETSLKLNPEKEVSKALAEIYLQKNNEEKWLSTLEDYLKTENYGLEHAQVQVTIANHFIKKKDWARARPYADAAGETWAEWALLKAGQCAEGMEDWEAAEQWFAASSQRYPDVAWAWYEFCRRTGKGHAEQALRFALPCIRQMEQSGKADECFRASVERRLANQPREAAAAFESAYRLNPTPMYGLAAALAQDEAGDAPSRDRILEAIYGRKEDLGGPQSCFAELAELLRPSKGSAKLAQADLKKLDEILAEATDEHRSMLLFLAGWYADRAGQKPQAMAYWKRCMGEPYTEPCLCMRSLAGAALLDRTPVAVAEPESSPPVEKDKSKRTLPAGAL
jgi:tetratricopeptide (TPR) repeat protein